MDPSKNKKKKRETRKTVVGIKLPPIEPVKDSDIKTIIDIDPAFYSIIEGRPIRTNKSIQEYKENIKNIALKRAVHGFLVDEIIRIDKEIESERKIYETAYKHFEEYQNSFDKFLTHDNNKTIAIMQRSDALAKELMNQNEEHKQTNFEMAQIKSKLQYIEETLMILLSFQNFLNKASPILWQDSHNIKLDGKYSEILIMDSDIYKKIDLEPVEKRLAELPTPQLYFENPEQLLTVFGLLEKQNLNYLLLTEELQTEKKKFIKALEVLKDLLREELEQINEKIKQLKDIITINEEREVELKEFFFRMLEEKMRILISSGVVLQIFNYVEFAYEQLIAPNEIKLSTLNMAFALEREYDNLMLNISVYDLNMIKQIEKETYENSIMELNRAEKAAKLLKDVDKLSKRLKSSYEPNRKQRYD